MSTHPPIQLSEPLGTTDLIATCWTSAGRVAPLWASETSPERIEDRIAAVAATGWAGLGISQDDLRALHASHGFAAVKDLIGDAGLRHVEVEILNHWWLPEEHEQSSHRLRELLLTAARDLGARHIKIATEFGPPLEDFGDLIAPLRELTAQAEDHGVRLALEPMPFSQVATVPLGARLVEEIGRPGCGLAVDSWHVFRAGTSLEEMASQVPADLIVCAELDDADREVRGTLFEDTINNRRFCGEGSFPLREFVDTLRGAGYEGPYGVEIISDEFRELPLREGLQRAFNTARPIVEVR